MILCSIVIPLYNKAAFIRQAIQSVLDQTYQNFEIIVVDDGSTDDGAAHVRAIEDHRLRLLHQPNAGVSAARNNGIALAKGELVCFLDADDWYFPDYLDTVVKMASQYPAHTFFATGYTRLRHQHAAETMSEHRHVQDFQIVNDVYDRFRRDGCFFCTNSASVRRHSLDTLQPCFPIGESMGEDLDLWFRLAEPFGLVYCPSTLVAYRTEVAGSLIATHEVSSLLPAFARLEQRALRRQIPKRLRVSAIRYVAEARITVARLQLIKGARSKALKYLLCAWRGVGSRRWWVSLAMCLIGTSTVVKRWECWRQQRRKAMKAVAADGSH